VNRPWLRAASAGARPLNFTVRRPCDARACMFGSVRIGGPQHRYGIERRVGHSMFEQYT
jgi:hypothetical protein